MKSSIQPVLSAFVTLRERLNIRRPVDPVVCRLRIPAERVVAWIWRDPSRHGRPLEVNETFQLFLPKGLAAVGVTWRPILDAEFTGDRHDAHYAWWFLCQEPMVAGGTYESIDNFVGDAADWSLATDDFSIVRCGSYLDRDGCRQWRHPSANALDWVADSQRCLVGEPLRRQVLASLRRPLPTGENLTIRRFFHDTPEMAMPS